MGITPNKRDAVRARKIPKAGLAPGLLAMAALVSAFLALAFNWFPNDSIVNISAGLSRIISPHAALLRSYRLGTREMGPHSSEAATAGESGHSRI